MLVGQVLLISYGLCRFVPAVLPRNCLLAVLLIVAA
jgi:hypothetical protein